MLSIFSQRDTKWGNDQMGKSGLKLKDYGCLCTSISMLDGRTPKEVNALFSKAGAYNSNGILNHEIASKTLGIEYNGFGTSPEYFPIIAEVDMSPSPGRQMHFVVQINDKEIVDPWTGTVRPTKTYPIISYRKYKQTNNENMKIPSKLKDEIKKYQEITKTSHKFGDNFDDKDLQELKEIMSEMRDQRNEFFEAVEKLKKLVDDTNKANDVLLKERQECYDTKQMFLEERDQAEKEVQALENAQQPLRDEVVRLTALVERNAKDTSILDALSFLLKSILNR